MSKQLRELQARKAKQVAAMRAITDKAAAESRDLTDDEAAAFDAERAALDRTNAAITREEALIEAERSAGISVAEGARITVSENIEQDPRRGFQSFGEFAMAVRAGGQRNGSIDQRLAIGAAAPGAYANEATGADGGFLIPPAFSQDIFTLSLEDDALLPMTDGIEVGGNGMVFPKDETTPWGTDGVRAYWQAEATQANATKPKLGTTALRLHKLMALTPVTDELLADANALESYLPGLMARSIRWKTNEAILFGTGAGQPEGAFNGSAAVVQAKDAGQNTKTVTLGNVSNMIARLTPGSFPRAVWLITPDALPSLFGLTLGNYPIYLPISQGAQGSPYGTLMGRPIMVSQHAAAFSAQGDISLVDLSYYRTITKAGGIQTATSMHLYFDADATAFRATFRVDGQPKIANPIQQAKGSNTLSPFIQLGAR
ncbi:TPA: phage major capsid protein [Burkholderia vietnamiensis]|uniref:phage major capsid protein n=1 Tax=Burkholderia vietnamiensis TaxID=60552 RepID=UPI001126C4C6|nr:phage major capsid protein [Burkholderia ubonensis]HDR9185279.1 phage major capsid protein [Burkholderia vietnamiensis]